MIGKIKLNFKIQCLKFVHYFIVVKDLTRSAILGRDFLTENKVRLYFDLNKMRIQNVYVPLENDAHLASRARATHHIKLAPQSACIVTAKIKRNGYTRSFRQDF